MVFEGRVQLRSSSGPRAGTGPPGETEVQRLNPQRGLAIRRAAGWDKMAPGSLNLAVSDSIVEELGELQPVLEEPAAGITYPPPHQHIPGIRKGYWYYSAIACKAGVQQEVLVRRAIVPVPRVVELFSRESLTEKLHLVANDVLMVEVRASRLVSRTGA